MTTQTKDRIILGGNPIHFVVRIGVSLWFAWIGYFPIWVFGSAGSPSIVVAAIGLYVLWSAQNRLVLEIPTRTYVQSRGIYPFLRRQKGSLDEFDHIHLIPEPRRGGQGGEYSVWVLRLDWKAGVPSPGKPPTFDLSGVTDRWANTAAFALADRISQKTGLPLRD